MTEATQVWKSEYVPNTLEFSRRGSTATFEFFPDDGDLSVEIDDGPYERALFFVDKAATRELYEFLKRKFENES